MCFSVEASFSTSALLLVIGGASVVRVSRPSQLILASTPLLFSIQQFSEGVLWLNLLKPEASQVTQMATYVFVVFGQILWPTWIPLSILLIEKEARLRKVLRVLLASGILISCTLFYYLLNYEVSSRIVEHHIQYEFDTSFWPLGSFRLFYVVPTVIPHFFSSSKKIQIFGLWILGAFIVAEFFYSQLVFSVWCFFAAVISLYIFQMMGPRRAPYHEIKR